MGLPQPTRPEPPKREEGHPRVLSITFASLTKKFSLPWPSELPSLLDRPAYFLVVPLVAVLGLVEAYPLAYSVYLSVTNYSLGGAFVGLSNYAQLFSQADSGPRSRPPSCSPLAAPSSRWSSACSSPTC